MLTLSIGVMQRYVGAFRTRTSSSRDLAGRNVAGLPGSTMVRAVAVGSDDSTAIRVPTASTAEFVAVPPVDPNPGPPRDGSDGGTPISNALLAGSTSRRSIAP